MAGPVVCSQCGARNPAESEWCGQCFASLGGGPDGESEVSEGSDPIEEQDGPEVLSVAADPVQAIPGADEPDGTTGVRSGTWVCSACGTPNPLTDEQCSACGTSIFTAFGAVDEDRVEVDPRSALFRSLLVPGLGHAHAGQGLLGAAIGGLTMMSLGFGIALVVVGVGSFGWPLILLAIGVWAAAAVDAFRLADGQAADAMLLRPRVVTALVGLVVVLVILAAVTSQGGT